MAKVTYIRVRPQGLNAGDLAWAVVLNGHLIATDSPRETGPLCGEIADGIAQALGTIAKEQEVVVSCDDFDWVRDVLPQVKDGSALSGIFVNYIVRYGEDEALGRVALELPPGKKPEEVVHRYFRNFFNFFAVGTKCAKKAREYWPDDECGVVQVESWIVVPPHEFHVLKKYF